LFPTFAALAGVPVEASWKLEGRDIRPLLAGEGKAPPPPALYWKTPRQAAVRVGDWKLIVSQRGRGMVELYNLADDPTEKKDLVAEKPKRVEALRKVLEEQKKGDG